MSFAWTVGGILMDTITPDADGVVWSAAVTGWDGPETNESWDQKPNDNGALEGPAFYSVRDVGITIWGEGPDKDTVQRARLKFAQRFELDKAIAVSSIETIPWTVYGRRSGKLYTRHPTPNQLEIALTIRCKDTRKYGVSSTVVLATPSPSPGMLFPLKFPLLLGGAASSTTVTNMGFIRTPVILTFQGPLPGVFWVKNRTSGKRIAFAFDLQTGQQFVVDGRSGTMLIDGYVSARSFRTLDSQLFSLEPGDSELQFGSDGIGSGFASVTFAPASMG